MNLSAINGLDFFVIAVIIWGAAAGFYRGLFRQTGSLLVLYVATALASQYYRLLARWILGSSARVATGSTVLIFLATVILTYFFIGLILSDLLRTYGSPRPLSLKGLLELGGMAIGFVQASLATGLALVLLSFAVSAPWSEWESVRQILLDGLDHSALASLLTNYLSQTAITLLPWLPAGLPPILVSSL